MVFDGFADAFSDNGGQWAFGITGGGPSLTLIDTLEKAGIAFVTTGHESTAALMAGACARVSQAPALAITIKGPGFTNMLPGLLSNAYEGFPSLSISESYAQDYDSARCHKWLDHGRAAGEFLKDKLFFEPSAEFFQRCWSRARVEYPGPVHIDLGAGTNDAQATEDPICCDNLEALVSKLKRSTRPLLIVGSAGLRAPWGAGIRPLNIPIFTTPSAKGLIDERSPNAASVFTGAGKPDTLEKLLLPKTDLLITLGVRAGEILNPVFEAANVLHIDTIPTVERHLFPAKDLDETTHQLSDAEISTLLNCLRDKNWGQECIEDGKARLQEIANRYRWSVVTAMNTVQASLPGATHMLDTGNFAVLGEHFLTASTPNCVLGTPNGRYMGAALGHALGASFAAPDTPVVLWVGDGGLRSLAGELALAADYDRKLLVLVMKDGYFGSIRGGALANQLSQKPVTLSKRSFAHLAEALGMASGVVNNEVELRNRLEAWGKNPQPTLLECILDPDQYIELTSAIR